METERWQQIENLFHEVVDLSEAERRAFLETRAIDDPKLVAEVMDLLANDATTDGLVDTDLVSGMADKLEPAPALARGTRLGPWKIQERIGRGGMGEVFSAERADGAYDQQVAVKVIRGVLDEGAKERLRVERQMLALLEHPNIARLQDGGTTEQGAPYLVMEFVDGEPIDQYCDRLRLGLDARVRLFLDVCEAVAHAHLHLIVHRDLKPGNVLVSKDGHLKLLDFGISKALAGQVADLSLTEPNARPMTPRYAAPEQILGQPITTATDVYALGVMLYELLTGMRPHELLAHDLHLHERAVIEDTPRSPSTAVLQEASSVDGVSSCEERSQLRGAAPSELRRRLAGDLDVVVMYALRKESERRYPNAAALREDLQRVLDKFPVQARPDTFAYRATRFVTRHRAAAVFLSLLVVALIVGTVTATRYAMLASQEAERADAKAIEAQREAERADAKAIEAQREAQRYFGVARFLTSLLSAPGSDVGAEAPMSAYLEFAERRLAIPEHVPDAGSRGSIHASLGLAWQSLSRYDAAERQLLAALECYPTDKDRVARAEVLGMLGTIQTDLGRYDDAEASYRRGMADLEADDPNHPARVDQLGNLAGLQIYRGDYPAAEREFAAAIELSAKLRGDRSPDHGSLLAQHADLLLILNIELDKAQREIDQALAIAKADSGEDNPAVRNCQLVMARIFLRQGKPEEARRVAAEALARAEQVAGDTSPRIAPYLDLIAKASMDMDPPDFARAEELLRRALKIQEETRGDNHTSVPNRILSLAEFLAINDRQKEAIPYFERAISILEEEFGGEDHTTELTARMHLGMSLTRLDRVEEARYQYGLAYAAAVRQFGVHDERSLEIAYRAGFAEERSAVIGKSSDDPMLGYSGAIAWYERAYGPGLRGEVPLNDPVVTAVILRAGMFMDEGATAAGLALIDQAVELIDDDVDPYVTEQLLAARRDFEVRSQDD